jgi:hypothetical protein
VLGMSRVCVWVYAMGFHEKPLLKVGLGWANNLAGLSMPFGSGEMPRRGFLQIVGRLVWYSLKLNPFWITSSALRAMYFVVSKPKQRG